MQTVRALSSNFLVSKDRSIEPFIFACPVCGTHLEVVSRDATRCPKDKNQFTRQDSIWRFLPPERLTYYSTFMSEYAAIRGAEKRGSSDPAYYRNLPFKDLSGVYSSDWRIRAKSYEMLVTEVFTPREVAFHSLKVLDLGAGNGWLSNRLALRGHYVAAVDLQINPVDGLGALQHYDQEIVALQAEFDHLPLLSQQADLVIYNASFHYSVDYINTLKEAQRVLKPNGNIVILDTPLYHNPDSGAHMVQERELHFQQQYGFPSNALPSQNFLTLGRLQALSAEFGLRWTIYTPTYGLRWAVRPWKARLLGQREPARFQVIVGGFDA